MARDLRTMKKQASFVIAIAMAITVPTPSWPETRMAAPPNGFVAFCERYPAECEKTQIAIIHWNQKTALRMDAVNRSVNRSIEGITDQKHWGVKERWDLAEDGLGDCEEYASVKKLKLAAIGFPRGALLLAVVWARTGGHAVLIARTDRGDLVLDNATNKILPPQKTRYQFVKRQTQSNPREWVYGTGPPR